MFFILINRHEIGMIDIPTMIDYVLQTTDQKQLFYIGHSQGTTAYFVMCSERPEYNAKIKMMHALAPVGYMDHAQSPVVKAVELVPTAIRTIADVLGIFEFLPTMDFFKTIGQQLCRDTSPIIAICESVLFLITGFNERNLNAVSAFRNTKREIDVFHSNQLKLFSFFFADFVPSVFESYTGRCGDISTGALSARSSIGTILSIRLGPTRKHD